MFVCCCFLRRRCWRGRQRATYESDGASEGLAPRLAKYNSAPARRPSNERLIRRMQLEHSPSSVLAAELRRAGVDIHQE
eukprot:581629-Prymnesium_polylepis.1